MNRNTLYIAYGSNLNLRQMAVRCPTAKVVGASELQDYELLFRGGRRGAVATVEPKEGCNVPVLLWKLKERDLMALDHYEGWPNFYRKEIVKVKLGGNMGSPRSQGFRGERQSSGMSEFSGLSGNERYEACDVEAMVYVMNDGHDLGAPSAYYYNTIREGYESAGFDTEFLDSAVDNSVRLAERQLLLELEELEVQVAQELDEDEPEQGSLFDLNWW